MKCPEVVYMLSSSLNNPTICKTRPAFDNYWYCLASMTSFCFHRLGYGKNHFCLHDDRTAFMDRHEDCQMEAEQG